MKEMETDLHFKAEIQTQTLLTWSTERWQMNFPEQRN